MLQLPLGFRITDSALAHGFVGGGSSFRSTAECFMTPKQWRVRRQSLAGCDQP